MRKETILIVEDDEDIRQLLSFNLDAAGYGVLTASTGREGLDLARRHVPDLVLLDIMLPGMSGFDVCKELKRASETAGMPVIMLTAKGEEVDRVVGLELGADDYVVKPFSPRELLLRIRAVLKRTGGEPGSSNRWSRDGLVVDLESHKVSIDGRETVLTATEFRLLTELIRRQGRVHTRDHLLNSVWGYEFEGYSRTVDTHVRRLRQKLGPYAGYVETVRGVGYRFKE